jgi:hypothetical protein
VCECIHTGRLILMVTTVTIEPSSFLFLVEEFGRRSGII